MSGNINFDRNNIPKAVKEQAKTNAIRIRNIGYLTVTAAGTSNAMVIEQVATGYWRAVAHVANVGVSAYCANKLSKRTEEELVKIVLADPTVLEKHQSLDLAVVAQTVLPSITLGAAGLAYLLGKRKT